MARLPLLVLPNQPLHIMHWGNSRQNIFENEDGKTFLIILVIYSGEKWCENH